MQAIILAAGLGKRLKELTRDNTKCMVKVNGVTLIERLLRQLEKQNLSRIVIVIGYKGQKLQDHVNQLDINTQIVYVNNPIYEKTNNIYSLSLAKDWLRREDTLLFESDSIFEDGVIESLIQDPRDTLALVDKYESWMEGTCFKLSENDDIEEFIPNKRFKFSEINSYYKTVNIYKFSKFFSETHYIPFLEAYQKALGENEYYEQVLHVITMLDNPGIKAKRLNGEAWYEIDDAQDLDIASSIFIEDDKKVDLLAGRYGGYWRYPSLLDFCYLVNPYFPPQKLIDEIKANFEALITQYPSGMEVNCLVAGKNFNIAKDCIVVGNGASELIKSLLSSSDGKLGIIRPTFEEYGNRYSKDDIIAFWPDNDNFSYTSQSIIDYFEDKNISNLVLINPDNPSGNYIDRKELLRLVDWTAERNIRFIVDESFVDFSDEKDATIIEQNILDENKNLFVIKSISKSYGVPGLRLGILASGDRNTISKIKKDVAIWNINSFAEFYMQIAEKYKKEYSSALERFRNERTRYLEKLSEIAGLRIIPTQANFVMMEIISGMSAKELTKRLISKHNILVKNLVTKVNQRGRQYIRAAIKTKEENDKLVAALKSEL